MRQKRLLMHLQKAEFSIEFHHIYLPWGWVKSLNAQEWDVAYDPKKWTQHQCYPTLGYTSWNKVSPTGHGAFPGIRPRRSTGGSLLPPIHPKYPKYPCIYWIYWIYSSIIYPILSTDFPPTMSPKIHWEFLVGGAMDHGPWWKNPAALVSSGSSLSELDLAGPKRARSIHFFWHFWKGNPTIFLGFSIAHNWFIMFHSSSQFYHILCHVIIVHHVSSCFIMFHRLSLPFIICHHISPHFRIIVAPLFISPPATCPLSDQRIAWRRTNGNEYGSQIWLPCDALRLRMGWEPRNIGIFLRKGIRRIRITMITYDTLR